MDPLRYLNSIANRGIQPGLERTQTLLKLLGHPESKFKSIHVTGTNGKGSVCAMLESILRASGYKTGLYTSPHLTDVKERIRINGENIPAQSFRSWIHTIRTCGPKIKDKITYFELLTVLAFSYFAQKKVDCAIVEVGLGGRLDATNALPKPEISIITNISLEHTIYLGKNLRSIAQEKGGIIKENGICLTAATDPSISIFKTICHQKNAQLISVKRPSRLSQNLMKNGSCGLQGNFQLMNIELALQAVKILMQRGWKISQSNLFLGFKKVTWPGRFEWKRFKLNSGSIPLLIDGAHNPGAIQELITSLQQTTYRNLKCLLIFNALQDKNISKMIHLLLRQIKCDTLWIPKLKSPRGSKPSSIQELILKYRNKIKIGCFNSMNPLWNKLKNTNKPSFDWCLLTGSLMLLGESFANPLFTRSIKPK